jgi:hypothetical protein
MSIIQSPSGKPFAFFIEEDLPKGLSRGEKGRLGKKQGERWERRLRGRKEKRKGRREGKRLSKGLKNLA